MGKTGKDVLGRGNSMYGKPKDENKLGLLEGEKQASMVWPNHSGYRSKTVTSGLEREADKQPPTTLPLSNQVGLTQPGHPGPKSQAAVGVRV